ncbi:MAG: hypothetical protein WCG98_05010 [bacterium]
MMLNEFGKIVKEEILNIPKIRKYVMIDSFVVMPNHLHLLLCIDTPRNNPSKGALHAPPSDRPGASDGAACNAAVHKSGVNIFGPQKNNLASLIR